jgi:ornithine cyclodeaminase/alanine dehydrogenase-like protein (mu-crystallin family)
MKTSGIMGLKVFNGSVEHGVRYVIAIYDEVKGDLLTLLDAAYLTGARTGATTGIATKYLARENSRSVGVIGSGLEGRTNLSAVCAVRDISNVKVFSPNQKNRERFASEMSATLDVEIEAVSEPLQAVTDTDIVVVATNTSGQGDLIAYKGNWMEPGQHINSIGATGGKLREIDPNCFARADHIGVDSEFQVETESGDAIEAVSVGTWDSGKIEELTSIVTRPFSRESHHITLFKSVGTAVQDVMSGYTVYQEAKRRGLGKEIDFLERKLF